MTAWLGLGAVLGFNYVQHRRHRKTMCAVTRTVIPEALFVIAFRAGADILESHVVNGYPRHRP